MDNTNIECVASHSIRSTESSGGFVGSLILKLSGMTTSTYLLLVTHILLVL